MTAGPVWASVARDAAPAVDGTITGQVIVPSTGPVR